MPDDPFPPLAYLTDGTGLFQIVSADEGDGRVWLEDCSSGAVVEMTVQDILAVPFRVVRPRAESVA